MFSSVLWLARLESLQKPVLRKRKNELTCMSPLCDRLMAGFAGFLFCFCPDFLPPAPPLALCLFFRQLCTHLNREILFHAKSKKKTRAAKLNSEKVEVLGCACATQNEIASGKKGEGDSRPVQVFCAWNKETSL